MRYTLCMRQLRIALLLFLLFLSLASCSPGHLGGNEIAFVRDGHLWTIDPSGANAFEVVTESAPVIGYAWSPDHHIFVFRLLDSGHARQPTRRVRSSAQALPREVGRQTDDLGPASRDLAHDGDGVKIAVVEVLQEDARDAC